MNLHLAALATSTDVGAALGIILLAIGATILIGRTFAREAAAAEYEAHEQSAVQLVHPRIPAQRTGADQ